MSLTIVVSGPRASEQQARTALAAAGFETHPLVPPGHSYGLTPVASGEDVREPQSFLTVRGDDIDAAHATVTPLGWRLRMHHLVVEEPGPKTEDVLLAKLTDMQTEIRDLHARLNVIAEATR